MQETANNDSQQALDWINGLKQALFEDKEAVLKEQSEVLDEERQKRGLTDFKYGSAGRSKFLLTGAKKSKNLDTNDEESSEAESKMDLDTRNHRGALRHVGRESSDNDSFSAISEGVISIKNNKADVEVQPASRDVPLLERDDFMSSLKSSLSPSDQMAHEGTQAAVDSDDNPPPLGLFTLWS